MCEETTIFDEETFENRKDDDNCFTSTLLKTRDFERAQPSNGVSIVIQRYDPLSIVNSQLSIARLLSHAAALRISASAREVSRFAHRAKKESGVRKPSLGIRAARLVAIELWLETCPP
ncbi:MAG: hypothetical protein EXS05_09495 [Planctomycetaceae bacterium]|nr:hypothetical protein [Planctomycetaceae bacterium]